MHARGSGGRRGAALTVFCLCAPFLVLLVSAIIEFGFLLSASLRLEDAARDGARWGAKGRDDAAVTATCRAYAPTQNMLSSLVQIDVYDRCLRAAACRGRASKSR